MAFDEWAARFGRFQWWTRNQRAITIVGGVLVSTLLIVGVTGIVAAGTPIEETLTVRYDDADDTFRFDFEYDLPSSVDRLNVTHRNLRSPAVTVVETEHVERISNTTFEWDGGDDPRIVLAVDVDPALEDSVAFETENAVFAPMLRSDLWYWYRGAEPSGIQRSATFDGEGFAGSAWVYHGPYDLHQRTVDGAQLNVVTSDLADDVDAESIARLYERGERLTRARLDYDDVTVFVMPAGENDYRRPAKVARSDVFLDDSADVVAGIYNTPSHEYFHVRFGVFGSGETYWLKEASAQYYGYLLSLNAGHGTFEEFRTEVQTQRYENAVLSEIGPRDSGSADYQKGAHVLAALDAEIRRQTGGEKTLLDVLADSDRDLSTYAGFKYAVVDATENKSMTQWIDTYVKTSALPAVPNDRSAFTLGDRTVEDFATPTPTPSATPTATPASKPTPTATDSTGEHATPSPLGVFETPDRGWRVDVPENPWIQLLAVAMAVVLVTVALIESRRDGG